MGDGVMAMSPTTEAGSPLRSSWYKMLWWLVPIPSPASITPARWERTAVNSATNSGEIDVACPSGRKLQVDLCAR